MLAHSCCVTGHRLLPGAHIAQIRAALLGEIEQAVEEGYTHFYSGFAEGTDLYFAEFVVGLMPVEPQLRLIAAIPLRSRLEQLRHNAATALLLNACSEIVVIQEEYHPSVYSRRNRYMVERCRRVIAVHDGRTTGGTAATLHMAKKLEREIHRIVLTPGGVTVEHPTQQLSMF